MQALTAPPRQDLTDAQVLSILNADQVTVTAGLELLDLNDAVVQDISGYLIGGQITHNSAADVHGTCTLQLELELAWGRDRCRPYMLLTTDDGASARWNLGVFLLVTPERGLGVPATFSVQGYDKLHLLQSQPGDAYTVPAGSVVLDAVRAAIAGAGAGTRVALDPSAAAKTLATAMVWPLVESDAATWLGIVNDLLASIGYRGLWCDADGFYRSEPYLEPSVRPIEWRWDTTNPRTTLVAEDRSYSTDVWGVPNWWRYVMRSTLNSPQEGAGFVTITNPSDGAASIASLGRIVRRVVWVDAVDQDALVTQARAGVLADKRVSATLALTTGPLPLAGHYDVALYLDPELSTEAVRVQAREWQLPLDGSDMTWTWEVV